MRPSIRSRLLASVTAFFGGFVLANIGVLVVTGSDRWLWLAVAVVLMITGAIGVLAADSRSRVSIWAVLGVELLLLFTLLPLLWTFTVATSDSLDLPTGLWPNRFSGAAFTEVLEPGPVRSAAANSVLVGGVATLLAMVLTYPAAYALVRRPIGCRNFLYGLFAAATLLPIVALVGASAFLVLDWSVDGSWLSLVPATLLISIPVALWLNVTAVKQAPWTLRDAVRADGATWFQELRSFTLPALFPTFLLVFALVFVVTAGDAVIGAALAPTASTQPLAASLLLVSGADAPDAANVAAAGMLWLIPALVLLAVAPRRIANLIGRTPR